ncbi:MAG TPA: Xaa-Pro peptidase family protein [Gemmatimonadales bacterium]|jgi:Xaa-Pro dipeptidase
MTSRRSFLATSSLALTGVVLDGKTPLSAQPSDQQDCKPLPPSITALASRAHEATPITIDERRARLDRARALMAQNHLDAIVVAGGTTLNYFTGMRWGNSERLTAVVIPVRGEAFIVTPAFEEERTLEQAHSGPLGRGTSVLVWQEDENPYDRVARGLKTAGIATGTIGIEETVKYAFADGIARANPAMHVASATPVTAGCRMIKSAHELALMKLANQVTLKVYEAVYHALQPGMTQDDAGRLIGAAYQRMGFPGDATVQVGEYTALPHGSATPQTIREGTIVMIDDGCTAEGYQSDITRTFVLGRATDRMKKVFDIEHAAQTAALKAARPGVEAQSVDAAARKVISDGGFGPDYKFFSHRVGHGIGMDGHEWPYLVRGNTLKLQPNMTFSDEPGIYIKGEFGIRLEDDMHITENGAELFTPQSPSLEHPFG